MYTDRVEFRKQHNIIEKVIKLMLNSSYGKTIEKDHNTCISIQPLDKFKSYITQHYTTFIRVDVLRTKAIIHMNRECNTQYTYPHIGS